MRSGQPIEDYRVELKAEWPTDHARAARRLAGHCNSAHGEPVLWVIGVDEERGVVGASRESLPDWLDQVRKHYEAIAPDLIRDLNVPVGDKTTVALLFSTERAPFVVKNPKFGKSGAGPIEREVPWRDGTAVRTARREDLLRLLAPIQLLPSVELRSADLSCHYLTPKEDPLAIRYAWYLHATLYMILPSPGRMILPYHLCGARFSVGPFLSECELDAIRLTPPVRRYTPRTEPAFPTDPRLSKTVDATPSEVIVDDAGLVVFDASCKTDPFDDAMLSHDAKITITLRPAGVDRSVCLAVGLSPPEQSFDMNDHARIPTVVWTMAACAGSHYRTRLKAESPASPTG